MSAPLFLILTKYFNRFIKYVVLYGFISTLTPSLAGSYEDFFQATTKDEVNVVSNLLNRGFDPNTLNLNAEPGLLIALKHEAYKVFEALLKHPKTNLNVFNGNSESPLMLVCLKGNLRLAQELVARKADLNHPGWTPLHYAATGGHSAIVKLLLDESAYIDAESPNGTTPLMMSARYGNAEVVKLLIDEGADIHLKNQLGLSALDFAKDGARPEAIQVLEAALRQDKTQGKGP